MADSGNTFYPTSSQTEHRFAVRCALMIKMEAIKIVTFLLLMTFAVASVSEDDDQLDQSFTLSREVGQRYLRSHSHSAKHRVKRQPVPRIVQDSYYNECMKKKGCVPQNCLADRNCKYMLSWTFGSAYIKFTLIAKEVKSKTNSECKSKEDSYVAVAFSVTQDMKEMLVIQCGKRNDAAVRTLIDDDEIENKTLNHTHSQARAGETGNSTIVANNTEMLVTNNQSEVSSSSTESDQNTSTQGRSKRDNSGQLEDDQSEDISDAPPITDEQDNPNNPPEQEQVKEHSKKDPASADYDDSRGKKGMEPIEDEYAKDEEDTITHKSISKSKSKEKKPKRKKWKEKKKTKGRPNKGDARSPKPKGSSGAQQRMLGLMQNKKVHMGWSLKNQFELYGTGCDENTDVGKIQFCEMRHDQDNNIVCQFKLKRRVVVRQEVFSLLQYQHYVRIVSGCDSKDLEKTFNNGGNLMSLPDPVHFKSYRQNINTDFNSKFARWHATLMISSWCLFVPSGMFFSRYLKESYVNVSCCKYRIWFAGHFALQLVGYFLSIAGIILIVKERLTKEISWAKSASPMHFRMGFFLVLVHSSQVFFGGIRCNGKKIRRVFAFFHLFCGLTCYILSMVLTGLSTNLGMPCSVQIFVPALVGWTIFCHAIMTVHFYFLDKKLGLKISRALYPFPIAPVTYDELPGSGTRLQIVILYFIGALGGTIGLVMIYWQSKSCFKIREFE